MKIALIIEYFDATRGGTEEFTAWLAEELVRAGQEVHVVCHDARARGRNSDLMSRRAGFAGGRKRREAAAGPDQARGTLHIHRLGGLRVSMGMGFRLFGWRAARWCRINQPDVVHSMTVACAGDLYQPHAGVYAEMQAQSIASQSTSAGVYWRRMVYWMSGKKRTVLAMEAAAARPHARGGPMHILSLCPMVTRHLSRHYEVDGRADGQVIELADPQIKPARAAGAPSTAADRAWFRGRHGIDASDRVAVFAGHDFRRKGLRQAIEAVAKTQRWKLVVAGQGRTREYARWADALGIGARGKGERRVLFLGPRQDMDVVYAAADALILPTFYDSFGLVAIEALARGLPVISTEFMGAAYLVKDHRTGTIVSGPEETEQMAGALEALPLPGEPGHAELAARARTAGMVMLPEKYVETLLGIYQQVLREKRNVYRPSEANGPLDEATAPAACPAASPGPS